MILYKNSLNQNNVNNTVSGFINQYNTIIKIKDNLLTVINSGSNSYLKFGSNLASYSYNSIVRNSDSIILYGNGDYNSTSVGLCLVPHSAFNNGLRLDPSGNTNIFGILNVNHYSNFNNYCTFNNNVTINKPLSINEVLDVFNRSAFNGNILHLKGLTDFNNYLQYDTTLDGPILSGYLAGKIVCAGYNRNALLWNRYGKCTFVNNSTLIKMLLLVIIFIVKI